MALRLATIISGLFLVLGLGPWAMAADNYKIDSVHSFAVFKIKHFNVSYAYGRFNDISGSFALDEVDPGASSVQIEIKAGSIDTHVAKRDQHLKSPDFFNAKQFPVITFQSRQVKKAGAGTYEVSGNLNMHGVTRSLTMTMHQVGAGKDPRGIYRTGFDTSFTIKRSEYGMKYMLGGLGDDVILMFGIEGIRQ